MDELEPVDAHPLGRYLRLSGRHGRAEIRRVQFTREGVGVSHGHAGQCIKLSLMCMGVCVLS